MQERTSWWSGPGGGREVLGMAWPLILANSFAMLQLTLDRVLLGWHHSDQVGAAMAAIMLFSVPLTLLQCTVNYVTSFVAQYRGAGQPEFVGPAVWQAIYLALGTGAAFLCFHPMADAIFAWAGHDPAQQALEADYFRCLCFAAPGFLVTAAVTGFFAGLGNTRTVLAVTGIGFAVNGILAWLWIFGRCGFPEAGIAGAGWAAVSATSVSALAALALFLRPEQERRFRTRSGWRLAWPLMVRLLRYGLPNGLLVALETLAFTLFVTFVGRMGQAELNATSIAFTLNLLAYFPVMGIAQASGVLVSQRLGEDRPDLAERSVWTSLRLALGLTACLASAYVLVPGLLVGAFESYENAEYWKKIAGLAVILLRFVAVYCFFDAANLVFSFSLRGAGDTIFVSIGTLALSLPMMAGSWESAERGWGVYIPWAFASLFPVCCALLFGWRFRRGGWRTRRIIGKENG